jgi:hypothetical protein
MQPSGGDGDRWPVGRGKLQLPLFGLGASVRVRSGHAQTIPNVSDGRGRMARQFIADQGIHVRVLQARGEQVTQHLGRGHVGRADRACHAHELPTGAILLDGLLESINSLSESAETKARGPRTARYLATMAYLIGGKPDFMLPAFGHATHTG